MTGRNAKFQRAGTRTESGVSGVMDKDKTYMYIFIHIYIYVCVNHHIYISITDSIILRFHFLGSENSGGPK